MNKLNKSYNQKQHNKSLKKPIDIESEFVGLPVGKPKEKPKRNDLTDELEKFLEEPITVERIKYILLRWDGEWTSTKFKNATIKIFAIEPLEDFCIKIQDSKHFKRKYYISDKEMIVIDWITMRKMNTSHLKHLVFQKIWNWLLKYVKSQQLWCKGVNQTP